VLAIRHTREQLSRDEVRPTAPAGRRTEETNEGAHPGASRLVPLQWVPVSIPALAPDEIATCLDGLARLEAELGSPSPMRTSNGDRNAYAHSPWFNALIHHPRILDAVEDVIGPNILVWTSTFFIKEPHSPTFAAWHQGRYLFRPRSA